MTNIRRILQFFTYLCFLNFIFFLILRIKMENARIILENEQFGLTIDRLIYQLIEEYDTFQNVCFVGIQPRGVVFAEKIYERLQQITGGLQLPFGKLDITFYRDDFRTNKGHLTPSTMKMDFLVEGKRVLLVDDVLYTGRSVQAAMTALNHYGRPQAVDLLALVDRRFNRHLPVQADFVGISVDSLDESYVKVDWEKNKIWLLPNK